MPAVLVVLIFCAHTSIAQKPAEKPRVPPGIDPGGVAVAIIGEGIDYTRAGIAARLARDGEGELIGWDFIDNDRRPFAACGPPLLSVDRCGSSAETLILAEDKGARLVPVRASEKVPQSLVDALLLVARGPSRVVLLTATGETAIHIAAEAGRRFPQHIFVLGAGAAGDESKPTRPADTAARWPVNLIVSGGTAATVAGIAARELGLDPQLSVGDLAARLKRAAP